MPLQTVPAVYLAYLLKHIYRLPVYYLTECIEWWLSFVLLSFLQFLLFRPNAQQ